MPALPSLEKLREDKRTHGQSDGRGPAPDASPGQRWGQQALVVLPTSSNFNLFKRFFFFFFGKDRDGWSRGREKSRLGIFLLLSLLICWRPPALPLEEKKNPTKGRVEKRATGPSSARPDPQSPPRPLGAQDGWALRTHPARLARPGPAAAAAGWLRPQPGAFQAGAEAEKKRKWGGGVGWGGEGGGPGGGRGGPGAEPPVH